MKYDLPQNLDDMLLWGFVVIYGIIFIPTCIRISMKRNVKKVDDDTPSQTL